MKRDALITAMQEFCSAAGVPITEFDADFHVRMIEAMMVSYHKYGKVSAAYPLKFEATSDVRARMSEYRKTGDKQFLVDAANFAMIEAMHPARSDAHWGRNDVDTSPGRVAASGHKLIQEDNDGNRISPGAFILHHPGEVVGDVLPSDGRPLCSCNAPEGSHIIEHAQDCKWAVAYARDNDLEWSANHQRWYGDRIDAAIDISDPGRSAG